MLRVLVVALLALGCGPDKGTGGPGPGASGPCAEVADTVRALYSTERSGNAELDAELLEANVHMVLADCETDAARFSACIRRAGTVEALERDCLVPLADDGSNEARRFGAQ